MKELAKIKDKVTGLIFNVKFNECRNEFVLWEQHDFERDGIGFSIKSIKNYLDKGNIEIIEDKHNIIQKHIKSIQD
ncbi:hypothetical protein P5F71_07870 [Clostridium perfringens]|nr:hypothetical protein [Clostridium perfringens]